jgi:uncharacterized tellurite resistance protein B-like protein
MKTRDSILKNKPLIKQLKTKKMNDIHFADHSIKKQNSDYFIYLVHVAIADGSISQSEWILLKRIGQRLGFSDHEIDAIVATASKSDYIPPYELFDRFEQVYEVVKMTLADGVIDNSEMRLASSFAMKSSFRENEIPGLLVLLMSGIKEGKSEEELFEIFRKSRR